jgi:steroid 5-alpha reductase family enzyme
MKPNYSRFTSFVVCFVAYLVAIVFALGFLYYYKGSMSDLWMMLVADIIATIIVFIFSVSFKNSSLYDPYWSVAPPLIAIYWLINGNVNLVGYLMLFAIMVWAIRLTFNWARGWQGLHHEDWRYKMLREQNPKLYPFTNFAGIHMFPTIMVFLGMLPVYVVTSLNLEVSISLSTLILGFSISLLATAIQLVADEQMRKFKLTSKPGEYINVGLWKFSRHPNYFGEISFWMGLWIMQMAVFPLEWLTAIGFIAMLIMFLMASIPMMEKKNLKSKIGYESYMKNVSMLIPWLTKSK